MPTRQSLLYLEENSSVLITVMIVLRYLVGAFFLFLAYKNLSGDEVMTTDFQRWQFSMWFKTFTGVCLFAAGILLFITPVSFYGGIMICFMMVGATYSHLKYDPLATAISPIVFLCLGAAIAFVFRPVIVKQIINTVIHLDT